VRVFQVALTLLGSSLVAEGTIRERDVSQSQLAAEDCGVRVECDITLVRAATLTAPGQSTEMPQSSVTVNRDRQGRFFVANRTQSAVLVFDQAGRLNRIVGSRGTAAGQFQAVSKIIVAPDDSVWIFDHRLRRLTQFSTNLQLIGSRGNQHGPALILGDGTVIVAEHIQTPDVIGYPIHSFTPDGRRLKSFGTETPQYRNDLRLLVTRRVAAGSRGTVWSVAPGRYDIEQWNPKEGTRVQRIPVKSPWFKEIAQPNPDETTRPFAMIESIWEHDNLVWLLIRDADNAWKPPAQANIERVRSPTEFAETFDWVIDAIDPKSARRVATRRFPSAIWVGYPSPLVASLNSASSGNAGAVDVWAVQLSRKGNKQ
jgi:hypothetical protein